FFFMHGYTNYARQAKRVGLNLKGSRNGAFLLLYPNPRSITAHRVLSRKMLLAFNPQKFHR
ncbi:hypothetical protein, partial [Acinetobacter indicus]|uniref:hypothetical protein n=1 Tax=Acinetobacter indicus TaxID=756892 RepID=UPI001C5FF428